MILLTDEGPGDPSIDGTRGWEGTDGDPMGPKPPIVFASVPHGNEMISEDKSRNFVLSLSVFVAAFVSEAAFRVFFA